MDMKVISEDDKQFAESTFMKKRMYYNMRIKTIQRNTTNIIRLLKICRMIRKKKLDLQIDKFKSEQKLLEETSKKYKAVLDYQNQLVFNSLPYENELMKTDSALKEKRQRWHESLSKDIYVDEAINVLSDLQSKELAKKTNVTLKKKDKLVKS
jgi:carboxyl-terminal processing protease